MKSFLYLLAGILFALVLMDKGMNRRAEKDTTFSGFKNISKEFSLPIQKPEKKAEEQKEPLIEDLEEESPDIQIPTVEIEENTGMSEQNDSSDLISVYYLKFYGKGNKSHSRLAKVTRPSLGSPEQNVHAVLDELIHGPNTEEKEKGILSAIPKNMTYSRNLKLQNGILYLNLNKTIESGAGPELMKDRLDQLTHSLLDLKGIRGIKLFIDNKKINSLGGDGIPVPEILVKIPRKIMNF
ncbi:MAG: GerMN domain-containing protein [Leptospira sp.]|nr:GerMN domain-containing protein [Leptospira sp.]